MMSIVSNGLLLWIPVFAVLCRFSHAILKCGHCLSGSTLVCPNYAEKHFEVKLTEYPVKEWFVLSIECGEVEEVDFSLLEGCSFPSVNHVKFRYCPFTNDSYEDVFARIGVTGEQVKYLSVYLPLRGSFALEAHHLRGLFNLTVLNLESTHLKEVSERTFRETPGLKTLYLRGNDLGTLAKDTFQHMPNLTILSLSHNNFTSLPVGLFDNLRSLKALNLWKNDISSLPPGIFDHLESLHNVTFHTNKLAALDQNLFAGTPQLQDVNFKRNEIARLSSGLFANCSDIRSVYFYGNVLETLPDDLFSSHLALKKVDLGNNRFETLPQGLFLGAPSLEFVKLAKNRLMALPLKLFSASRKLESLDLSSNSLGSLHSGLFAATLALKKLDISNNSLVGLENNLLSGCRSLRELNLQANNLMSLSFNAFPPSSDSSLRKVDFSKNNLTTEGIMTLFTFALNQQLDLEEIDFSHNRFDSFPSEAGFFLFTKLRRLSLQGNSISWISLYDILSLTRDVEVDLRHNHIQLIEDSMETNNTVKVYLEGNNFTCNCRLYKFIKDLQEEDLSRLTYQTSSLNGDRGGGSSIHLRRRGIQVLDRGKLVCRSPTVLQDEMLTSVDLFSLTCLLPTRTCSPDCPCLLRPFDNMVVVNCAGKQRTTPPAIEFLPGFSYTLDLSHNRLSSFNFASDNPIVNLTLKDNLLVTSYLSNSSILPPMLRFLHLGGNNLTYLKDEFISQINSTGAEVDLEGNPWTCDCHIKALHDFVQARYKKVVNVRSVVCALDRRPLVDLTEEDVCPVLLQPMVITSIGVITALLVLFAVLGTVSFYRYKTRIKVWLFAHQTCLWLVTEDELDVDKQYDAFISYSHKDEAFVNNYLVPGLEKGEPNYRVCLHYRDWVVGEFIQNQILDSVHNSRRTLVILSTNFMESVWGQMEFRVAHQQALQDKTNRVIVIVYGEMPPEEALDEELRHYVKLHTYLKWDDPRFWDSLRYAMPHPRHLLPKRGFGHRPKGGTVKLELVNGHVVPAKENAIPV